LSFFILVFSTFLSSEENRIKGDFFPLAVCKESLPLKKKYLGNNHTSFYHLSIFPVYLIIKLVFSTAGWCRRKDAALQLTFFQAVMQYKQN